MVERCNLMKESIRCPQNLQSPNTQETVTSIRCYPTDQCQQLLPVPCEQSYSMYTDVIKIVILTNKKRCSSAFQCFMFAVLSRSFMLHSKTVCLVLLVVFGFSWCVLLDTGQNQRQYWMYNSSGDYRSIFYSLPIIRFFLIRIKRLKLQTSIPYEQIHIKNHNNIFKTRDDFSNGLLQNTNVQLRNKTLNISRIQISLIFKCCIYIYGFHSLISPTMLLLTRSVLLQNFLVRIRFQNSCYFVCFKQNTLG